MVSSTVTFFTVGMPDDQFDGLFHATEEVIFDVVDKHGGSISAEHGIGRVKQDAFLKRADPLTLELSRRIKDAFDPRHLLSEGRILASADGMAGGRE